MKKNDLKVLIVGSGGREHALVWKCLQSPKVSRLYCAPGNGGTAKFSVPIRSDDIEELLRFALLEKIDLTIVGPEVPLAQGISDRFQEKGLLIFGVSKKASQIESSKVFSKNFMKKYGIPTAEFGAFQDLSGAISFIN